MIRRENKLEEEKKIRREGREEADIEGKGKRQLKEKRRNGVRQS
jgi:hypothetical protein